MPLTKEQLTLIGVGAAGLVMGMLGGSLFSTSKPLATGLSRMYRVKGKSKSAVAISIVAVEDGYLLEYEAPYGVVGESGEPDEGAASELFEKLEEGPFAEPEDAAAHADDVMESFGYKPQGGWTDALEMEEGS